MDEHKFFLEILEKYGWPGLFAAVWVSGKLRVWWKKNISKNFTSYEDIHQAKEDIKKIKEDLQTVRENTAMRELEKDRFMEGIQSKLQRTENRMDEFGYIVRDISSGLKTNNRIMGEVKDFLERWGEKNK